MKKLYILFALALCALTAGAQNLQFSVKGQPVENGARIDIAPYLDSSNLPFSAEYNPELTLKSAAAGAVEATVVFTSGECLPALDENWEKGGMIKVAFCSFDGQCIDCLPGETKTKKGNVTAGSETKMDIELTIQNGFDQVFDELKTAADFTVTCKQGSDEVSVTFYLNDKAGINDIVADENSPKEYFDLQGRKVITPAAGNLYIVRQGSKVTKQLIR